MSEANGNGYQLFFTYNDEGIRTSKTVNGVEHTYRLNGNQIVAEEWTTTDVNGAAVSHVLVYLYDAEGAPVGMQYRNQTYAAEVFDVYWYEKNLQGDIVAVYDNDGTPLIFYHYDAWGNIKTEYSDNWSASSSANLNPFLYRGYYYDSELGMYYLQSRYYDPVIGRFLTADKLSTLNASPFSTTDKNLFAYCDNNPVMRKDDGGMFWDTVFDVASLVFSVAEVVANPADPWAWAGVIGDVVDLIPFVSGVGEVTKAVGIAVKAADAADDVIDAAKTVYRTADKANNIRKATGSYEIIFESGKNYVGKGGFKRAIKSAETKMGKYGDKVVSIEWKSAKNTREAFLDEYKRMSRRGVRNDTTYNQIWSPGRNYYLKDLLGIL